MSEQANLSNYFHLDGTTSKKRFESMCIYVIVLHVKMMLLLNDAPFSDTSLDKY